VNRLLLELVSCQTVWGLRAGAAMLLRETDVLESKDV
jgi:hypothetical protein